MPNIYAYSYGSQQNGVGLQALPGGALATADWIQTLIARGKADKRIADMADGAIGHQAFDALLRDGGNGAPGHGEDGDQDNHLLPLFDHGREGPDQHAQEQAEPRDRERQTDAQHG